FGHAWVLGTQHDPRSAAASGAGGVAGAGRAAAADAGGRGAGVVDLVRCRFAATRDEQQRGGEHTRGRCNARAQAPTEIMTSSHAKISVNGVVPLPPKDVALEPMALAMVSSRSAMGRLSTVMSEPGFSAPPPPPKMIAG